MVARPPAGLTARSVRPGLAGLSFFWSEVRATLLDPSLSVFDVYPSLTYIDSVLTFVETKLFTRLVQQYLSDDEYAALQRALMDNPDAGDLIRGSGGVRKLRWGLVGRGKRGGIRVIYFLRSRQGEVWMLTLYAKNEAESIPGHVLKKIKEEIDGGA